VGADQNPNAATLHLDEQQDTYARAAAVTFGSLRRWNPGIDLVWFTNGPVHPSLLRVTQRLEVSIVSHEFTREPPDGYMSAFQGCLYILDAIDKYRGKSTLYLDPDIVCTQPLADVVDSLGERVGALPMHFAPNELVNGLRATQLIELSEDIGMRFDGFLGGEAIWVPECRSEELADALWRAYARSVERFKRGEVHLATEEHLLSAVLGSGTYKSLEPFVRRIWTTSRCRSVRGDEDELALWHLPAEKARGFRLLYSAVMDPGSWFWSAPPAVFLDRCGRALSLHHRKPRKLARDLIGQSVNLVSRRLTQVRDFSSKRR